MRNLALGSLLFCGLAAVLGYVATSGVGMRTTGFSQSVVDNIPVPPRKAVAPVPEVEIEAVPLKAAAPLVSKPATVRTAAIRPLAARAKPRATKHAIRSDSTKGVVALAPAVVAVAKRPSQKPPVQASPLRTQSLDFTVDSQPTLRDESQDMQRDKDAKRQWREQTLARWREQQKQQAESNRDNRERQPDRNLDATPAGGLYKAEPEKKSRKRHRFLFIRW